jgi:hypothetical protein
MLFAQIPKRDDTLAAVMTGYLNENYVRSLSEFGTPRKLPLSGGWILEREIAGFPYRDGIGCYPIFVCRDYGKLDEDMENLAGDLVSLTLVTDPFGNFSMDLLKEYFGKVTLFKNHFIADLGESTEKIVSRHHHYYARKALENVEVELVSQPVQFLDEWMPLYDTLIKRHNIRGINTFSQWSFEKQLQIPGIVLFAARSSGGGIVGGHLWYIQGNIAYSHLQALSESGYQLNAGYALHWVAMEYFRGRARWMELGGASGLGNDAADGLYLFKKGWSNATRPVYLCGHIFDQQKYDEITAARGIGPTEYFPAYRNGDFNITLR